MYGATGFGKTRVIINTLKLFENETDKVLKCIWVVSSVLTRDEKLDEELVKWQFGSSQRKMRIRALCYESLDSEYGPCDVMVMDEFHNITEANTRRLLMNPPPIIIACTGSKPTRKDKVAITAALNLKVVYELKLVEAKEKGYVNNFELFIYKITLDNKEKYLKGWKTTRGLLTEYERFQQIQFIIRKAFAESGAVPLHLALMRKRFLQNLRSKEKFAERLIKQLKDAKLRHIIFCAGVTQADKLCNHSYHYENNDSGTIDDFNAKYIDSFSCIKAIDESHNLVDVDSILLMNLDREATTFLQRLGRAIRVRLGLAIGEKPVPTKAYILVAKDTVEEEWMNNIISDHRLSTCKINYYNY